MIPLRYILFNVIVTTSSQPSYALHHALEWEYAAEHMPKPRSDISADFALAPDDDGDLFVNVYLLGGCDNPDGYIKPKNNPKGEFICPSVSSDNVAFDPHLGLFSDRAKMLRPRYRHDAVTVDGNIWVVGGRDVNDNVVREVDVYFPAFNKWRYVGDLPRDLATSDLTCYTRGEGIIVIGGYNSENKAVGTTYNIDTVKTLDQPPDKKVVFTRKLSSMDTPRGDINVVTYARYAYVMGGFTHENDFCEPLKTMEVYDTDADQWVYLAELNEGRGDAAVVKFKGKFYVLGGETKNECGVSAQNRTGEPNRPVRTVEVYDPLQGYDGKWEVIDMKLPKDEGYRYVATSWPDIAHIFIFGGISDADLKECNCLKPSDLAIVFSDELKKDINWWAVGTGIVALIGIGCAVRKYRKERYGIDTDVELHGLNEDYY